MPLGPADIALNLIFSGKTIFHFKQLEYQLEITKNDEVFSPDTELKVWEQNEWFVCPCCSKCLAACAWTSTRFHCA